MSIASEVFDIETELRLKIAEGDDCTELHAQIAALGLTRCVTCANGCTHSVDSGSCGHRGCWGRDATNDCPGIEYARLADR